MSLVEATVLAVECVPVSCAVEAGQKYNISCKFGFLAVMALRSDAESGSILQHFLDQCTKKRPSIYIHNNYTEQIEDRKKAMTTKHAHYTRGTATATATVFLKSPLSILLLLGDGLFLCNRSLLTFLQSKQLPNLLRHLLIPTLPKSFQTSAIILYISRQLVREVVSQGRDLNGDGTPFVFVALLELSVERYVAYAQRREGQGTCLEVRS